MVAAQACAASLYHAGEFQSLTGGRRAHAVGDLLTVLIYEDSSATSAANTSTGRDAAVGVNFQHGRGAGINVGGDIKSTNELDGHGLTQRQGQVLAQLTVSVKDVAPNGDLLIAGEQLLEINNEKQQIKVAGRVRPSDISDANTVLSTRIADAKISYVGDGDLAKTQRPSWWHRMLTWFGL